jgi:hypothetical protein
VDSLLENAHRLLETALEGPQSEEWTVYLDREGALHLIAGADAPLESVLLARAAAAAWRIRRQAESVLVEGFDGDSRCCLQGRAPNPARGPLSAPGLYLVDRAP